MSSAALTGPGDAAWTSMTPLKAWLAVLAGTLGGFMALLDTSIANAALPVIQGEIGATPSEGTWISTAYLMTEIVVVPLTAWLERLIGLRRYLVISAALFIAFSILCGISTNLTMMIVGRLGQGISGGLMIPAAYSIVARVLPADQQSKGMAVVTGAILISPILGPLIGGWLTEQYSWHYAFFVNIPVCGLLILLLMAALPASKGDLSEIGDGDWFGIVGMIMGLGALTVLLEEGNREQWFESTLIWQLAFAAALGFILIAIGQFWSKRPVVQLRLLGNRMQMVSILLLLMAGMIMYCSLFIVPQYLALVRGTTPLQSAQVLLYGGVASVIMMVLYPAVVARAPIGILVMSAAFTLAFGAWLGVDITSDTPSWRFGLMQFLVGGAMSFLVIPVQQVAMMSVRPSEIAEMTSLVTVARNLGGSISLAVLASFQDRRLEFHRWRLTESVGGNDPSVWETLRASSGFFGGGGDGWDTALRVFNGEVMHNALVMTFSDSFFALSVIIFCVAPIALLLPRRMPGMDGPMPAH